MKQLEWKIDYGTKDEVSQCFKNIIWMRNTCTYTNYIKIMNGHRENFDRVEMIN